MLSQLRRFVRTPLFPIFLIVFTDVVGMGIAVPVLPLFAQGELAASPWQVALLHSVFFMAQFVAAPRLGRLSDRIGRKPVLVLSQFGSVAAMLLTAWAPSLWVIYAARALDGVTAGNVSVALAYVGDVSEPQDRARAMGVVNAGFGAGFMFGPALGGALGGAYGPRVPFLAAAGMAALSITLTSLRLKEPTRAPSEQPDETPVKLHDIGGVRWLLVVGFGMQFALMTFTSTWVLWADAVLMPGASEAATQRMVGYVFTFIGTCSLLTQAFVVGPAVRRFGERKLIMGGLVMRAFGFGLMGAVPRAAVTFTAVPFASVGGGVATPSAMANLANRVPGDQRGAAMGFMNAAQSGGRVLGPLLAGGLFEHVAPAAPLFAASAICLVTAGFATRIPRPPPGRASTLPTSQPYLDA